MIIPIFFFRLDALLFSTDGLLLDWNPWSLPFNKTYQIHCPRNSEELTIVLPIQRTGQLLCLAWIYQVIPRWLLCLIQRIPVRFDTSTFTHMCIFTHTIFVLTYRHLLICYALIYLQGDQRSQTQVLKIKWKPIFVNPDFYKVSFWVWFEAFNIEIAQRSRHHWVGHVLKHIFEHRHFQALQCTHIFDLKYS